MNEDTSTVKSRGFIKILPGILISLIALLLIFFLVDWQEVWESLKRADYQYLLIGIPIYLLSYVFRASAWRALLTEAIPLKKVFLTMQAGYLLNNVLPFRLGEVGRALILSRAGLGFWRVFSTIVIERAFDLALAAGLLLSTMPLVWGSPESKPIAYFIMIIVLIGLSTLHLLARYQARFMKRFEIFKNRWSLLSRINPNQFNSFFDGLTALVELSRFFQVLIWMILSWVLGILYLYFILLAFDSNARFLWASFGLASASLGVALPSTPSYVGVFEAVWIGVLSLFNVSLSKAFAFALTIHIIHIMISFIFGVYTLVKEGESLTNLYSELRERRFKKENKKI